MEKFREIGPKLAADLANSKDKYGMPLVYTTIRDGSMVMFDALVDAGASLKVYYGPNQGIHIAAMYGRTEMARKMKEMDIKPLPNLRNELPSGIAKKYKHDVLAKEFDIEESKLPKSNQGFLRQDDAKNNSYGQGLKRGVPIYQRSKNR
jgi:hypothetical protein